MTGVPLLLLHRCRLRMLVAGALLWNVVLSWYGVSGYVLSMFFLVLVIVVDKMHCIIEPMIQVILMKT